MLYELTGVSLDPSTLDESSLDLFGNLNEKVENAPKQRKKHINRIIGTLVLSQIQSSKTSYCVTHWCF